MLVACDTVLLCTAAIGEVPWHVDAKLVCPVYGAAGDFISDSLSNRPDCAFDVSGQRVIDVGFVGEYDFNLCAVGKRLRNHHEGLRIGSKASSGVPVVVLPNVCEKSAGVSTSLQQLCVIML